MSPTPRFPPRPIKSSETSTRSQRISSADWSRPGTFASPVSPVLQGIWPPDGSASYVWRPLVAWGAAAAVRPATTAAATRSTADRNSSTSSACVCAVGGGPSAATVCTNPAPTLSWSRAGACPSRGRPCTAAAGAGGRISLTIWDQRWD